MLAGAGFSKETKTTPAAVKWTDK